MNEASLRLYLKVMEHPHRDAPDQKHLWSNEFWEIFQQRINELAKSKLTQRIIHITKANKTLTDKVVIAIDPKLRCHSSIVVSERINKNRRRKPLIVIGICHQGKIDLLRASDVLRHELAHVEHCPKRFVTYKDEYLEALAELHTYEYELKRTPPERLNVVKEQRKKTLKSFTKHLSKTDKEKVRKKAELVLGPIEL